MLLFNFPSKWINSLVSKIGLKSNRGFIVYDGSRKQSIAKNGSPMKSSRYRLFAQVLGFVDCRKFAELARAHGAERAAKGFGSWDQFVAMAFAPLADAGSLREISLWLASASGKLRHLGIDSAPCRPTLSCANPKRAWQFFADLFAAIYAKASAEAARQGFAGLARRPHGEKSAATATRLRVVLRPAFGTAGLGYEKTASLKTRGTF